MTKAKKSHSEVRLAVCLSTEDAEAVQLAAERDERSISAHLRRVIRRDLRETAPPTAV